MSSRVSPRAIATLGVAVGLSMASQAQAHAHLVSASPAENSATSAPKLLALHFSEKLEPAFSGVEITKADGGRVAIRSEVPANDRKAIVGTVNGQLSPGVYRVQWHAVSADSHRTQGAYTFTVR
jgi:copper resistance protein C